MLSIPHLSQSRRPASRLRIWEVRQKDEWGRSSCFRRQSVAVSSPRTPWPLVPRTGIFLGPSKSGKTVALISMILEQYRGVFEKIYIFSPSVNRRRLDPDLGVNAEKEQLGRVGRGGAAEHRPEAA